MAGKPGKSGGVRKGAGRKKNPAVLIPELPVVGDLSTGIAEPDSIRLLRQVTNDTSLDAKLRLDAAKALAPFEMKKVGEGGKKEGRAAAAKKAGGGKFAPAAPPKLVAAGGKKV